MQNNFASPVSSGSIVVANGTMGFTLTTTASSGTVVGVVYEPAGIANGAVGRVAIGGVIRVRCADDTVVGYKITTSTSEGEATDNANPSSGTYIGNWLEACDGDINGSGWAVLK
jgi:hypothetical protein